MERGPRVIRREAAVEEAVKPYRVAYERDEACWWVATVRGVRGCHTQGRTVRGGSAPHPSGARTVRGRCAQSPHCRRREAADRGDKGNSGLRDSAQKG